METTQKYRTIPVKSGLFKELKQVKSEAERDVGTRFDWETFILAAVGGLSGAAVGYAVGKAIKKWQQQKTGQQPQQQKKTP